MRSALPNLLSPYTLRTDAHAGPSLMSAAPFAGTPRAGCAVVGLRLMGRRGATSAGIATLSRAAAGRHRPTGPAADDVRAACVPHVVVGERVGARAVITATSL